MALDQAVGKQIVQGLEEQCAAVRPALTGAGCGNNVENEPDGKECKCSGENVEESSKLNKTSHY